MRLAIHLAKYFGDCAPELQCETKKPHPPHQFTVCTSACFAGHVGCVRVCPGVQALPQARVRARVPASVTR